MTYKYPKSRVKMGDYETHTNSSGAPRTTSLFLETNIAEGWEAVYSLSRKDKRGCPSMFRMFMEDRDPTGYTTCMRTVGNYWAWRKIWGGAKLNEVMTEWEIELEAMLTAEAVKTMRRLDTPVAAKWLADKGWEQKRGRPSKVEKAQKERADSGMKKDLAEDAARVMLN